MKNIIKSEIMYKKIINVLCDIMKIKNEELFKILEDKECKYLLLLLLKKYRCADSDVMKKDFDRLNKRVLSYNLKKAEEKFFVNRNFRELYFEVENSIEEIKKI
ncbi:MAG: ribose-5-phosphate isomerase [Bacillota bacterium]|nr:ribose-5-phosphate isomerase [Bacillota bacterium]